MALALCQGVWEWLAFAFGQEHYAEDGEDGEGREDDVVEEVATIILEFHQGGGSHANTTCRQHQTKATTSDREQEEEQGKENNKKGGRDRGVKIKQYFISRVTIFLFLEVPCLVCLNPKQICSYRIHQT